MIPLLSRAISERFTDEVLHNKMMSWVDHVLTTASVDNVIDNFSVLNGVIVSLSLIHI